MKRSLPLEFFQQSKTPIYNHNGCFNRKTSPSPLFIETLKKPKANKPIE